MNIENILALAEQPSRYLGTEINRIRKDHDQVKLKIALAFPDLYEIGTSHFGIQILYNILNQRRDIAAERVFAPAPDMENLMREAKIPMMSLESRTPLNRFDIIGFSLLYELNYTNILTILDLAEIPFFASERNASHPFVIAGGPCVCNPEPVADFFDAIVIGDGEDVVLKISDAWLAWKQHSADDRTALLKEWAKIQGVYVPALWDSGEQVGSIRRVILPDLDTAEFPNAPVIPFGKPVHDRLRIEIARGCTRGCRFCQAGMIYRPVRERSAEHLLNMTDTALVNTGYNDISLLSLSTGDYTEIVPLLEAIMTRCESRKIAVSLPSLRAGTLTPEIMELIRRVRKTSFTIAPEAGSQRLRDVLNKNVSKEDIAETVKDAFGLGWQLIKLYFMIGLPTETEEDLDAIVALVKELRSIKGPRSRKLNVSIGTFVPKPHTPFQWASQLALDDAMDRVHWLKRELDMPGIQVKWQNPQLSLLEGIWGRGDRLLSKLLLAAWKNGCKFDGWSDHFRYRQWEDTFEDQGFDPDVYLRERNLNEQLPWDHIDIGVSKEFLKSEWQKAVNGELTRDCRNGECNECGVCDFKQIEPKMSLTPTISVKTEQDRNIAFEKYKILYSKLGEAKYLGHLEMVNIFLRAMQRADIAIRYSQGFHPMPKVSFDDPLPIGMESEEEFFYLFADAGISTEMMVQRLNPQLPEGLKVHQCIKASEAKADRPEIVKYRITLRQEIFDADKIRHFESLSEYPFRRINRKGNVRDIDLKAAVAEIGLLSPNELYLVLRTASNIRPTEIVKEIFGLSEEVIRVAGMMKLRTKNPGVIKSVWKTGTEPA